MRFPSTSTLGAAFLRAGVALATGVPSSLSSLGAAFLRGVFGAGVPSTLVWAVLGERFLVEFGVGAGAVDEACSAV